MKGRFKIEVWYEPPPIPVRTFDWHAIVDGGDERDIGHGATPRQAVEELLEQIDE